MELKLILSTLFIQIVIFEQRVTEKRGEKIKPTLQIYTSGLVFFFNTITISGLKELRELLEEKNSCIGLIRIT